MEKKRANYSSPGMSHVSRDEFVGVSSSSSLGSDDEFFEKSVSDYEGEESPELFEGSFASSDRSEIEGDTQSEEDSLQQISEKSYLERTVLEHLKGINQHYKL
jgi:hypothetical protein